MRGTLICQDSGDRLIAVRCEKCHIVFTTYSLDRAMLRVTCPNCKTQGTPIWLPNGVSAAEGEGDVRIVPLRDVD